MLKNKIIRRGIFEWKEEIQVEILLKRKYSQEKYTEWIKKTPQDKNIRME